MDFNERMILKITDRTILELPEDVWVKIALDLKSMKLYETIKCICQNNFWMNQSEKDAIQNSIKNIKAFRN